MRTNWADHVVITIDGNTLENVYQEWIAYKKENIELKQKNKEANEMLRKQGEVIKELKAKIKTLNKNSHIEKDWSGIQESISGQAAHEFDDGWDGFKESANIKIDSDSEDWSGLQGGV